MGVGQDTARSLELEPMTALTAALPQAGRHTSDNRGLLCEPGGLPRRLGLLGRCARGGVSLRRPPLPEFGCDLLAMDHLLLEPSCDTSTRLRRPYGILLACGGLPPSPAAAGSALLPPLARANCCSSLLPPPAPDPAAASRP
jgi:hypothetical protein